MTSNKSDWESVEPEIWKPVEAGDTVEGILLFRRVRGGKYNKEAYCIEDRGKKLLLFGTTVLEEQMRFVSVGDFVRVVYKGTQKGKKDNDIKLFEVLKRREPTVIEERIGGGHRPSSLSVVQTSFQLF